jgi:hypothetical protein
MTQIAASPACITTKRSSCSSCTTNRSRDVTLLFEVMWMVHTQFTHNLLHNLLHACTPCLHAVQTDGADVAIILLHYTFYYTRLLLACMTSKQMAQTSQSFSSAAAFKGPSFSARVLNTSIISPAAAQLRQYSYFCSSKASTTEFLRLRPPCTCVHARHGRAPAATPYA